MLRLYNNVYTNSFDPIHLGLSFAIMKLTKQIALLTMIALLVVHIFSTALVSVHYQINKDFIAKNFCENRSKPKMNCNGKCHLKKTMKRLGGEKTESKSIQLSISEYINTPALHIQAGFAPLTEKSDEAGAFPALFSGFATSIFRPPLV